MSTMGKMSVLIKVRDAVRTLSSGYVRGTASNLKMTLRVSTVKQIFTHHKVRYMSLNKKKRFAKRYHIKTTAVNAATTAR